MMKKLLVNLCSLLPLAIISTNAFAHPGHLTDESVHGFLHIEHIIVFVALIIVTGVIAWKRDK